MTGTEQGDVAFRHAFRHGHFRRADAHLQELLEEGQVLVHPLVVGELACVGLVERGTVLSLLKRVSAAPEAKHEEALGFIERHRLMSRGIGYIDVHLLAATTLAEDACLWTVDARLAAAASRLFITYEPGR